MASRIRDYAGGKWGLYIPMENLKQFIAYVEGYSGRRVLAEKRLTVNSPEAVAAMTALQDLVYRHEYMPPKLTSSEAEQMFLSGNLGLMMGSSSQLVFMQTNLPYNLTVWGLPFTGASPHNGTGSCLAVTSEGIKRGRDVFSIIEHLVNYQNAIEWHTHTGSPAILNSARNSLDLLIFYEENPNYLTPLIELERGLIFAPRFDAYGLNSLMRSALDRIMIGGEDPARILDETQAQIDVLLLVSM
jgi:ABC-type glycerol-3-phosphate transport system substrate-binding protein